MFLSQSIVFRYSYQSSPKFFRPQAAYVSGSYGSGSGVHGVRPSGSHAFGIVCLWFLREMDGPAGAVAEYCEVPIVGITSIDKWGVPGTVLTDGRSVEATWR